MTNLKPYEFRDPAALMSEIAERVSLDEGTAHLVLVDHPATTQRIVRIDQLRTPAEIFEYAAACEEMRDLVNSWPVPDVRPPRHASMLVVVRPGWCVFGPNEMQWCLADRYLNHWASVFTGDVVLVTEHGWLDFMTHEPAMSRRCGAPPERSPRFLTNAGRDCHAPDDARSRPWNTRTTTSPALAPGSSMELRA